MNTVYKPSTFIGGGAFIYSMVGAILGVLLGSLMGVVISLVILVGGLLEPKVVVFSLAAIPLSAIAGGISLAIIGFVIGVLRGTLIGYSLKGNGLIIFMFAVLLAFLGDIISGIIIFLIWKGFRGFSYEQLSQAGFGRFIKPYLLFYTIFLLGLGALTGLSLGGLAGYFLQKGGDFALINLIIGELSQYINSFSLQAYIDTIDGTIGGKIKTLVDDNLEQIVLESSLNLTAANLIGGLDYTATGGINNFIETFNSKAIIQNHLGIRSYIIDSSSFDALLSQGNNNQAIIGAVSGTIIGAANGTIVGLIIGFIYCILDYWIIKRVSQKYSSAFGINKYIAEEQNEKLMEEKKIKKK